MNYSFSRNPIITLLLILLPLSLYRSALPAEINLKWDPPDTAPNLSGYKVYYGTASGTYGAPIDIKNVTTYTLTGLTQGQTYFIAVTDYSTSGKESGYSNEVSGTAKESEAVSTPSVLAGPTTGTTGTSYTYTTGGSSSNLGHSVEYQFDWKGDASVLSPWGFATQSKTWASAGTYNVRSRARCTIHTSVVSNWVSPLSVTISAAPQSYTVTTNPSGLQIIVDEANYTAPQTFSWTPGASHRLSVSSPQNGTSGTRYVYSSWSDSGAQTHTITVPPSGKTYTANFRTQYSLTTSVNPSAGGMVSPSGTNWYGADSKMDISAKANPGYRFSGWSGDLTGTNNPDTITLNGPKYVVAIFSESPTVTVLSPNGDEVIPSGSTYPILWSAPVEAVNFSLFYSLNNGTTWKLITDKATDATFDWQVPKPASNKNKCRVKIRGFDSGGKTIGTDRSDRVFTIEVVKVASPEAGESLISGRDYTIIWETNGTKTLVDKVRLFYTKDGGITWKVIDTSNLTGNPGQFVWIVPSVNAPKKKCKVKIVLKDATGNNLGEDTSNGFFAINP